jgi:O-antigen ligase
MPLAGVVPAVALFFVWPIPHSNSLREALLLLAVAAFSIAAYRRHALAGVLAPLRGPAMLLAALTAWIVFVAVAISAETAWSLDEVRGHWIKPLVAGFCGLLVAAVVRRYPSGEAWSVYVVLVPLVAHVLYIDALGLMVLLKSGLAQERVWGLTENVDKASYVSNMLVALLLAEALARALRGRGMLAVGNGPLLALSALALFSVFVGRTRNGIGALAILVLCAIVLYAVHSRRAAGRRALLVAGAGGAVVAGAIIGIALFAKPGATMHQTLDTIPVALDTQGHKGWLDEVRYGLPALPDGSPVDASAYVRIAWIKEGLIFVADNPWGIGFGRNAFGHAMAAKYGAGRGHSHSSVIDLLVGIGVPGVLLWFAFLGSLMFIAIRRFSETRSAIPLALFFVVTDFAVRSLVDSNVRDHMLQQFMFLVALLAVLATAPAARARERAGAA